MEDNNSNLLNDSKNEWSIRLMNVLSGHIIDGFRSIFNEAMEVCEKNDEAEKYLMTFQNFLSMIPKWNQNVVDIEVVRIKKSSQCDYLEDLITCVHIIQLKILSCVRTSNDNKKIDIDIPCFKSFLHVVYINIARKLYSNIYLFQIDATPLEQQKNNREFELIVQTCIINTIRDNIPIEELLKQYIDETQEIDVVKTEKILNSSGELNESTDIDENSNKLPISPSTNGIVDGFSEINRVSFDTASPSITTALNDIHPTVESNDNLGEIQNYEQTGDNVNIDSFNDFDDDTNDDNTITIGEDIPLNTSDTFDMTSDKVDIPLQEVNIEIEEKPIDLGVEVMSL